MNHGKRMTIDQPSTLQQYHHLHNVPVLMWASDVCPTDPDIVRVYFLSGPAMNQNIHKSALIKGWR